MGVSHREPIRRAVEVVKEADGRGIDCLWLIDSQLIMKDVHVVLALCAAETTRVKLATGVTNPLTRHLTVTANAACALQEVSDGRFILGLGAGDSAVFPLGLRPASIKRCEANLHSLRTLFNGEEVRRGEETLRLKTARPVPLFLSAGQPRMLRLAGRAADGAIILGVAVPEVAERQIELVRQGAAEAGRDPSEVFIDLWLTMSVDEKKGSALAATKSWASTKARWLATWQDLPPVLEPYREDIARAAAGYDFAEHLSVGAGHKQTVSDDFAATVAIAGTPAEAASRLRPFMELGIDRITLTLLSGGRMENLRLLCEKVIPAAGA
jgi:5,10-methylenetetrahydromethanopterin reductase